MIISRSPFRISFFGGGTDYPAWFKNRPGAILGTTIDKYAYITCRFLPPFFDHSNRIVYSKIELTRSIEEIEHPVVREALRFLRITDGIEIHHDADLPARTGLGSSSTFAVGLLNALSALQEKMCTRLRLAEDAIKIEQHILKENVGCQDQVLSAFGGLNRVDFHPDETFTVSPIILSQARRIELSDHMLLFFTGFTRLASEIAGEQIDNIDRKTVELERMYRMVAEGQTVLTSGTMRDFGELLHEAWLLKRGLSSRVSTAAIDDVYENAMTAGAWGGKLLGAGGGGFMLLFAPPENHAAIKERLHKFLCVPFNMESGGSQIIFYQP